MQALSRSLAATKEISVDFFSSGYLDVSVLRVHFINLINSVNNDYLMVIGLPHSGIVGSMLAYQLTNAFRRLLRPSSPLIAKAFTICAYYT